ncbi:MAG: hypothetical protein RLZZ623_3163, partial [Actinomycetota bacterium]
MAPMRRAMVTVMRCFLLVRAVADVRQAFVLDVFDL